MSTISFRVLGLMLAGMLALASAASADQPDPAWPDDAPAGTEPSHDFQLPDDGCYAQQLAGVLGGAFGGFVGSRIGDGDRRTAAVAAGTMIGYLLGSAIGRSFDEANEGCAGKAPEQARTERTAAG